MIYFLQSLLLPLSPSCYNCKLMKVIILNIWLFTLFHSFREMLDIHKLNISLTFSIKNLITILFSFCYLYTVTYVNYKISYRNEDKLLPKEITQNLEFLLTFMITSFLYIYIYIKIPPKIINAIYHGIIFCLAAISIYYFYLNYNFLSNRKLLLDSYFITLSKFAIIMSMVSIIGMIALKFYYPHIPTFFILFSFFLFYNFRLYKNFHNNIVLFPVFEEYNVRSYKHHGL